MISEYITDIDIAIEDRFDNGIMFETETTNEGEINDLAWKHTYEIANSDIKDVRWYKFVDGVVNVEPMVVISKAKLEYLLKCKETLNNFVKLN